MNLNVYNLEDEAKNATDKILNTKMDVFFYIGTFNMRAKKAKVIRELRDERSITKYYDTKPEYPISVIDLGTGDDFMFFVRSVIYVGAVSVHVKWSKYLANEPFPASERYYQSHIFGKYQVLISYLAGKFNEVDARNRSYLSGCTNECCDSDRHLENKDMVKALCVPAFCNEFIPRMLANESDDESDNESSELEFPESSDDEEVNRSNHSSFNNLHSGNRFKVEGPVTYPSIATGGVSGPLFGTKKGHPFGRSQ
ncbi:hypothetical protein BN7_934 [Wickerhamomyces ciferrii]|uniref:Uncharacterized protein n=1 Tax=Wickerhamomyces ciferrii (strain ATCC 14091 / BCRC 22168 / CBS 111 / JCM 3599 / NBRC 0793 / NRRL Y-1031 F-60-10) TaxID=1206466 RepID=K0KJV6_WICCF|nr:uncharacterized protein BN7_934 [Wickerhamomyces ciferrii]CCH41393.1 hypothetical protein BN7_934 [Wickerhamomyces ciferrii]